MTEVKQSSPEHALTCHVSVVSYGSFKRSTVYVMPTSIKLN